MADVQSESIGLGTSIWQFCVVMGGQEDSLGCGDHRKCPFKGSKLFRI